MKEMFFSKHVKAKIGLVGLISLLIVACSPGGNGGYEIRLDNRTTSSVPIVAINDNGMIEVLCNAFNGSTAKMLDDTDEDAVDVMITTGNCKGTSGLVAAGVITVI